MKLKIPTQKEVEEADSETRYCEKCSRSEEEISISYATGFCDECWKELEEA